MNDQDLVKNNVLQITVPDAYELAQFQKEKFIEIRRDGFGASDSSVLLGVNPYHDIPTLIAQKCATDISEEEKAVGEKENVRKGADLEPIILNKFEHWAGVDVYKPDAMYKFVEYPFLTVNFDGIIQLGNTYLPVEAKFVSAYASKYWDRSKRINTLQEGTAKLCGAGTVADHIIQEAQLYGIPAYYYTQVQQQLLALQAPFGYLVALFDKGWELNVYKIFADKLVQAQLVTIGQETWKKVQARKQELGLN